MKPEWVDATSYGLLPLNAPHVATTWKLKLGGVLEVILTRDQKMPDFWMLRCPALGLNRSLGSKGLEHAKSEAMNEVKERLLRAYRDVLRYFDS